MQELPSLLLAYGISLKQVGNEFSCLCFAHDDHKPSMSVYKNGDNKWTCHCFSCGHHSDVIAAYCYLNDMDTKNPQHFLQAKSALEGGDIYTGKPFAIIENGITKLTPRPERTMLIPTADTKPPKMNWLKGKDGREWGEPDEVFIFRQPDGTHWMYEARWNIANTETGEIKKEPRVFSYGRRGSKPPNWECAHHLAPRPLFGLDVLAKLPKAQVVVCEGARKAQAAQTLIPMLACVGWAGGAKAWSRTDWSPIENRSVILWPDADEPERTCMAEIAQQLIAQGCTCFILNTDDKPDAWDAVDAIKEGWDTQRTLAWAKANKGDAVKAVKAEEKKTSEEIIEHEPLLLDNHSEGGSFDQPTFTGNFDNEYLSDDIPAHIIESQSRHVDYGDTIFAKDPVDLFDDFVVPALQRDMLPEVISNHIFDLADVINTDPAFGAITALTTIGGLLDDRIKIHLNEGYNESARLWTLCIGEPSTKKSPIMDAVRNPTSEIISKVAADDAKVAQRQKVIDARYEAKLKEYTKACIDSDNHTVLEPTPPDRLERRRIKCDNTTREALEEMLRDMPSGIHLHADELSGWIGSMDAYKQAGVKSDRPMWLRAFNGGHMHIARVGRGEFDIENWSVSISGGIQPSKLASMAGQLDDDGLLQRFLIVCSTRDGDQGLTRPIRRDYYEKYAAVFDAVSNMKHGNGYVHLTPEAASIRNDSVKQIYDIIKSGMIGRAFCTALGKWEGVSARLILIYHAIECATQGVHPASAHVQADTARMAMHYMMHHLLPHMVSFYEDGLGQSDISDATRILAGRILAEGINEITLRWLGRNSPSRWRSLSDDKQRQVLSRLVEYGWLEPVGYLEGMSKKYKRYLVNPIVHDKFTHLHEKEKDKLSRARDMAAKIRRGEMLRHNEKIYD